MKILGNIIGQPHLTTILQDAVNAAHNNIESQEMTHSWLFTGPPGSGRSIAAASFAAALICPNKGCGICVDCETAMSGSHVDIEIVKTEGLSLKVDEIRELISHAAWAPSLRNWRIVIIEDAERLTEAAANALLKVIEEPGSRTIWILCSPSLIEILPTIRSRCRILQLRTPSHESIVKLLVERDKINPELANHAARISQGHIGRAKYLAQNPETISRRKSILELILNLKTTSNAFNAATKILELASQDVDSNLDHNNSKETEELKNAWQGTNRGFISGGSKAIKDLEKIQKSRHSRALRDSIDHTLLDIASIYRDAMIIKFSLNTPLINSDLEASLIPLAKKDHEIILKSLLTVLGAFNSLELNGSQTILLEVLASSLI
jgi:DNA polymerase-3 subunit delta'